MRSLLNRRRFLGGLGVASAAAVTAPFLAACGSSSALASGPAPNDVLNFALNLEYLEANFYLYATTGTGLPSSALGGGPVATGGVQVTDFTSYNSYIQDIANEIAADEKNHVEDLRSVLGGNAVAQPAISLAALGIDLSKTANFLAVARLFEDVGVTAYAGAAQYLSGTDLTYAAQILAVEAFHSGNLRLLCLQNGITSPSADSIDSPPSAPSAFFFETPASSGGVGANESGVPPSFAPTRTTSQVLAIVYGAVGSPAASGTTKGGLFPSGFNGNISTV
jgi:hypothetical protein